MHIHNHHQSVAEASYAKHSTATPFSIYIHVPFCLHRCGYCDFNTFTAPDLGGGASRQNYGNLVVRELQLLHEWQRQQGFTYPPVSSVYFGGGTPTVIPIEHLTAILSTIRDLWGIAPHAEITTEANPDTVDECDIAMLAQGGFNRISFGMQSAVPSVLRTLERTHTPANVERCVQAARKAGLRVSVDLIYGAPGETLEEWQTSVQTALQLGVEHISAYALTIAPRTAMGRKIAQGLLPQPSDDDEARKYEIADTLFSQAGLQWYEISNWAKAGYESQHNLGYWRNIDWAGIGPGAHGHFSTSTVAAAFHNYATAHDIPCADTYPQTPVGVRAWDIAHPKRWATQIAAGILPLQSYEVLSQQADIEERLLLGLRLRTGLNIAEFQQRTGRTIPQKTIDTLVAEGLITIENNCLIPTLRGRLLNDAVITDILDCLL